MRLMTRMLGFVFTGVVAMTGCGDDNGKSCGSDTCGAGELCCTVSCGAGAGTPICYSGSSCPAATCDMGIHDMTPRD